MTPPWYVITGGPSAGKTTVLKYIEEAGYTVLPETARTYIDAEMAKGRMIEEIRIDEKAFQEIVLATKIDLHKDLSKDKIFFFDRGIPDTLAYFLYYGWEPSETMMKAMKECPYKKVFLLDLPPYKKDYARIETDEARQKIHDLLGKVYRDAGFEVVTVPVFPDKKDRAKFILKNL